MDDREAFDVWFENYDGDSPDYWTHEDIEAAWQAARAYEAERVKGLVEAAGDVMGNYSEMTSQNAFERRVFQSRIAKLRAALAAYRGIKLSPKDTDAFVDALKNPPEPNEALIKANRRFMELDTGNV